MAEITKETVVTTQTDPSKQTVVKPVKVAATSTQRAEYIIYFLLGVLEVLLAFRLVFKLTGASLASAFVGLIYSVTGIFVLPFEGIFRRAFAPGVETTSVFEPGTVVAIVVYAIVAWGIVKLVKVLSGERQAE
jgi:hypothetical protein